MNKEQVLIGVLIEESYSIPFNEVCHQYRIPKELLVEMIEHGLFTAQPTNIEQAQLNPKDLRRMESAFRLHKDLGVNLEGVALALDLLDELETVRKELEILRKQL